MRHWPATVAVAVLLAAAAAADPRADALYRSAVAKNGAADYSGAIADAEAATAIDPSHWRAWQLDGNARYALGDKAGAVTVYRYSLRANPDNPRLKAFVDSLSALPPPAPAARVSPAQAAYDAALARYEASDYEGAMQNAAAAVRADPNHWQAWQVMGNARYARGDKRGALEAYDRSLALNPDNPQVRSFADSLRAEVGAAPPGEFPADTPAVAEGEPQGFVRRLSVRLWGGYGPVGSSGFIKEYNDGLAKTKKRIEEDGGTISIRKLSSLTQYGGEIGIDLVEGLTAGLIGGFLASNEAGDNYKLHDDSGAPSYIWDDTYASRTSFAVTVIMIGGRYVREVAPKVFVRGGLFAGLGSMSGEMSGTSETVYSGTFSSGTDRSAWKETLDGSGTAFQVVGGVEYRFSPRLGVALDAGFRSLKTDIFGSSQDDNDGDGTYEKTYPREVITDDTGNPDTVDFGGVFGTLSVGCHF